MEEALRAKSELILSKGLRVPEGFAHPMAEPDGEGGGLMIISFGDSRMRMRYSADSGDLELRESDGRYSVHKGNECLIDDVGFVRAYCHSPYQANVNLTKFGSDDEILSYLDRLVSTGTVEGIPISGCSDVDRVCEVVSMIHSRYPDIPIGYSASPVSKEDLLRLKAAGLSEFKITLGSTIPRIFALVNPDEDMDAIIGCLKDAVEVFGKGKVCTGISVGMNETDEEMVSMFERISSAGVLTDLKVKKITAKNRQRFEDALGKIEPVTVDRLCMLGSKLKEIQERNGLDARDMHTLCLACMCCNIVPFRDC